MRPGGRWGEVAARVAPSVLLLALTLPFAGRAYHVDDPLYVEAARRVLAHPFDPLGGASFWHARPGTLFDDLYNPPLVAYLLAVPVGLGGGEAAVHVFMIALAAAALYACAAAGAAWGVPPRHALVIAASPALCLAAVSALTDVPFLLLCVLAWREAARERPTAAGVAVALSALTKYLGLANLLLVLLLSRGRRAWVPAAITVFAFGGYCAWNLALDGRLHVLAARRFQSFGLGHQSELIASFVAALGLVGMPAALGLLRWSVPLGACAAASGAAGLYATRGGPASPVLAFLAFAAGGALLAAAAVAVWRRREPFLCAAFWGFALYVCVFVYFGTARYLLPLLPPLLWLLVRGGLVDAGVSNVRLGLSVAGSAVLSLALLHADAGYADAWREAARRLPTATRGFHTGRWGFTWYAAERDYRPLAPDDRLQPGDIVAEPRGIHVEPGDVEAVAREPRSVIRVPSPALRTMDASVGAGFYSSAWGVLPFGWRPGAFEEVVLSTPSAAP